MRDPQKCVCRYKKCANCKGCHNKECTSFARPCNTRIENPTKQQAYWRVTSKRYYSNHLNDRREYCKNYQKDRRLLFREQVVELLGGRCVHCGIFDPRVLQIDHINGGGREELEEYRLSSGRISYMKKILSMKKPGIKYQLLCANCNWIKRVENKEYGTRPAKN